MELDFETVVQAWERKEITRDQLSEHLKELGHNSEFVIEGLEYDERQEIGDKMKKVFDNGDFEEAQECAMKILDKYWENQV